MHAQRRLQKIIEPDFLLMAYCSGYFPMADSKNGPIGWYSPDPRGVLELESFHIARSLRLTIKKKPFEVVFNQRFESVMRECARREETWISEDIIQSYLLLHRLGFAHSVECLEGDRLVGGLYGVAIGGAFFGESMFSQRRDASKIALVYLVQRLKGRGYVLLDTQFVTPHLARFGATEIPRDEYLKRLANAIQQKCRFDS
jgi:leucyl/phenylalanyl-tRNA--protein transferase